MCPGENRAMALGNWKLTLPRVHFNLFLLIGRKGPSPLSGMIDPDHYSTMDCCYIWGLEYKVLGLSYT